ncbi:MAG: DMT family transporter [Cyclobacteriaceae bacterium]|nr:DMT family transporter [Cyclobacteriaceae bacterium]
MIRDYIHLHFLVLIWGFTAILGLLITIPAVEVVFYRTLIASTTIGIWIFLFKNKISQPNIKSIIKISLTGFIIAAHWILFFAAAKVSNASVCLAGLSTTTLWTSFIEPMIFKRKIKFYEVLLGLLIISGLYVIFRFEFNHQLGLIMGIGSAFLAALFSVINGKFALKHDPYHITFYEMLGACIGTVLFLPFYINYFTENGQLQLSVSWSDFGYLLILAIVCTVYAFSASVELLKRITVFMSNLTINLEPVYGIILALIFFGEKEKMGGGFYLGTGIIVLSILSYPLLNKLLKRKALEMSKLK